MFTARLGQFILLAVGFATIAGAAPAVVSSSAEVNPSSAVSSAISSSLSALHSSSATDNSPSSSASAPGASPTVPYASGDPNGILWGPNIDTVPQAIRGSLGATVLGPQDIGIVKENPDLLAPPTTDSGTVYDSLVFCLDISLISFLHRPNAKWPMSLSHNRLQTGGWARQQNGTYFLRFKWTCARLLTIFDSRCYANCDR